MSNVSSNFRASSMPSAAPASGNKCSQAVSLPGGLEVQAIGINGSQLELVGALAKSWRESIAAADAGQRSCQVR